MSELCLYLLRLSTLQTLVCSYFSGMDPAGPWFEGSSDKTVGINTRSGRFVDIIHTDSVYGTTRDLGHIDFYPNGGKDQTGCTCMIQLSCNQGSN